MLGTESGGRFVSLIGAYLSYPSSRIRFSRSASLHHISFVSHHQHNFVCPNKLMSLHDAKCLAIGYVLSQPLWLIMQNVSAANMYACIHMCQRHRGSCTVKERDKDNFATRDGHGCALIGQSQGLVYLLLLISSRRSMSFLICSGSTSSSFLHV